VVSVVSVPVLDDLFRASQGGGAFCNGKRVSVSNRSLSESYLAHSRAIHFDKM